MAYDFPNSPTIGQRVTMPDSTVRSWDGTKWRASSATGSYTPPSSPRLTTNFTPVSYPGAVTTEQDLQTYSLPAGSLASDGQVLRIRAYGTCGNLSAVRNCRLYFGATIVGLVQPGSGGPFNWMIDAIVVRTGATTQMSQATALQGTNNTTGQGASTEATPAETLSGPITIKTTGQSTLAGAGAVVSSIIMVELL